MFFCCLNVNKCDDIDSKYSHITLQASSSQQCLLKRRHANKIRHSLSPLYVRYNPSHQCFLRIIFWWLFDVQQCPNFLYLKIDSGYFLMLILDYNRTAISRFNIIFRFRTKMYNACYSIQKNLKLTINDKNKIDFQNCISEAYF